MNMRMMTIRSLFAAACTISAAMLPAAERGLVINPLRNPVRNPAAEAANPGSHPDLWRNPGQLRPADTLADPDAEQAPHDTGPAAAPAADGGQPPAERPPRTLIQRIRERRLAQLEKQAERLRQLSAAEDRPAPAGRESTNLNGPENPDLQIDIGVPVDAPAAPAANPSPLDAPASLLGPSAVWPPAVPAPAAVSPPTELNPPADPPREVNIELPSDVEPPQPKPALQGRVRSWWSSPALR